MPSLVLAPDPDEFKAEVLRQAAELYGGRDGIQMDTIRILAGGAAGRHRSLDTPDFQTQMVALLDPAALLPPLGSPPTIPELFMLLGAGSPATSLNELPNSILGRLAGHGVRAIAQLFCQLREGTPSTLLNTVLHIPLRKKEPAWLVANSRPVLLEPALRRLEATAVFRRQQRHFELHGVLPSCMFAYRKQLNPQVAALLTR